VLVISRQQQVFFQQQQYLRLAIYSIVPVVVLVNWLSFRDGLYFLSLREDEKILKNAWLFGHLLMVFIVAGICFFQARKRFQHKRLRISLQLFCLVLLVLSVGFALSLLYQCFLMDEVQRAIQQENMEVVIFFLMGFGGTTVVLPLLSIPLVYYALQPSEKRWKWLLKKASMLLSYTMLLIVAAFLVAVFDNALTFHNPIPTGLRFLLLMVAGAILARALFSQFKAYQPQRKWLTMIGFAGVYSFILYLSLIGFWNDGIFTFPFPSVDIMERVVFYYEISDALTLLLALTAAGFATVWGIQAYQSQKYLETGIYSLSVLFLVSSAVYYFQAYMSMISFFTVVFGGILLFIHVVSGKISTTDQGNDRIGV